MAGYFSSDGNHTYFVRLTDADTFETYGAFTVSSAQFQGNQVAQIRTANQPVRIDFTGGQHIVVSIHRSKVAGFTQATVQLTGYLTDVPCSPPRG